MANANGPAYANTMRNIVAVNNGNTLVLKIDLSQEGSLSEKGNAVIANSSWHVLDFTRNGNPIKLSLSLIEDRSEPKSKGGKGGKGTSVSVTQDPAFIAMQAQQAQIGEAVNNLAQLTAGLLARLNPEPKASVVKPASKPNGETNPLGLTRIAPK